MAIVTDGLLAYWNSKQGISGTTWANIAPATTGNYDATLVGATITADGTRLDGVDDYLMFHIPTEIRSIVPTNFEFRLKLSNYTSEPDVIMINGNVMFFTRSNGFYSLGLFGISGGLDTPLVNNNEYFISIVSNPSAGTFTVYVNGISTIAATGYQSVLKQFANNATATQWITANNGYYPNGIFDNVRFYNRALSATEISQNYAVGREVGLDGGGNVDGNAYVKTFSETISLSENITKRLSSFKTFDDSITTTDAIAKRLSVVVADSVAMSENESENTNKSVIDLIPINDTISISNTNARSINLTDSILIIEHITKRLQKGISDTIDLSDSFSSFGGKSVLLTDSINITDSISVTKQLNRFLSESVNLSDDLNKNTSRSINLYDVIVTNDDIDLFNPNAPNLIGIIHLQGKRDLFVYLQGKRDMLVYLQGERKLTIFLKGGLNVISNQNFNMVSGDSKTIIININEDLTGASFKWVVRKRGMDSEALIKQGSVIDGQITITLNKGDTEELKGIFNHECEVTDQNGNVSTITKGTVNILADMI